MKRLKSVPKNGVKNETLAEYVRRFAEAELPVDLREDGVAEALVAILETAPGVDVRCVARRAIWRLKTKERRHRLREIPESSLVSPPRSVRSI